MFDSIFQHGVASGDPLQDRVILWTRLSLPDPDDQQLAWAIAADPQFRNVVGSGTAMACTENDHTIHADAMGLQPGRRYFYRFHALGQTSPIGCTKTLPRDDVKQVRFAQVSSARFGAGYFNAYARIAAREDLDFILHLGGYIHATAGSAS
ncbi:MAG TPA: PhoD-like phosphatase N-terminal domain-containing protein, partial [Anaerolineales bacterium]|nr:PhoD-like phosphatase N-terminal domain-containing protein [Anaerolineales bacterium]